MNRVGRYLVEETNADGTLRARDPGLDRVVTLNVLRHDADSAPEERARFERNARAAAAVDHPNIVRVLETGVHEGTLFVASELVSGPTLEEASAKASTSTLERWLLDVAKAMAATHEAGIVHRGIDARHVRITPAGLAKLGGFSAARREEAGPDSFRTKTIASTGDTTAGDRASWGAMAALLLAGRSSRMMSVARRARAAQYAETAVLLAALVSLERRPRGQTKIFVGAAVTTFVALSILVFMIFESSRRTSPSGPAQPLSAVASVSQSAAPPVVPVLAVASGEPLAAPARSGKSAAEAPGFVFTSAGDCFDETQGRAIRAALAPAGPALASCLHRAADGTVATIARMQVNVSDDGSIRTIAMGTVLADADDACLRALIFAKWPNLAPNCAQPSTVTVHVERGCRCYEGKGPYCPEKGCRTPLPPSSE